MCAFAASAGTPLQAAARPCGLRFVLVFLLFMAAPAVGAVTLDSALFCTTDQAFHFDLKLTGAGEELIVSISADNEPFNTPTERIRVNFDSTTGEVTRVAPVVLTNGTPPADRWLDGPIADFAFVAEGGFSWRLVGSISHGPDRFFPGDTINQIGVRGNVSVHADDLPVDDCAAAEPLQVPYTGAAPTIDGRLDLGEWRTARMLPIDSGFLSFLHDNNRLYVLVDVLDDSGDDSLHEGGADQFWLLFDIDEDRAITSGVDRRYRLDSGTGNLRYEFFCEECLFGFSAPEPGTRSSRGEGFGCFVEDFSRSFLPAPGCSAHRVWELALDLDELDMRADRTVRFGYLVGSGEPEFSENLPTDLNNLVSYLPLQLERQPAPLASSGPGSIAPLFEVTQAIQTPANDVDLVAGKPTALRVWSASNDSGVVLLAYGAKGGVDLPGSPLRRAASLFSEHLEDPRDSTGNGFLRLPEAWTTRGSTDFRVVVLGRDGVPVADLEDSVRFASTATPVLWTVPIRNLFPDGPFTRVDDDFITRSERALRRVAPLQDATFVRRPLLDLYNVSSSAQLKEQLRTYDAHTVLAWTLGLLFTGDAPFALPDQTTGFNATGFGRTGGSSDPARHGGSSKGRISWIAPGNVGGDLGYAHELNHNLDADAAGTWGRHAPGCDAGGTDPSWPYGSDSSIQQVGLIRLETQFSSIAANVPDFMSYCASSGNPRVWISPYRWSAWLDLFRTDLAKRAWQGRTAAKGAVAPADSFYIMGRVFPDGSGQLGQVLRQPGIAWSGAVDGAYVVDVLACDRSVLDSAGFTPSFIGAEGEQHEFVSFDFVLAAPPQSCSIELRRGDAVVDSRVLSANAPVVTLLVPDGGESWSGVQTASWTASDADGDALRFTLLYSADAGATWLPVATDIGANTFDIDSTGLPGSTNARVRVLASDGAHTGEDDSDADFTVAFKPPSVEILAPPAGTRHDGNRPLVLEGVARDTFGMPLPPASLLWTVDGVPAGDGAAMSVVLAAGAHGIQLAATGADGSVGVATRSITVTSADLVFANSFE